MLESFGVANIWPWFVINRVVKVVIPRKTALRMIRLSHGLLVGLTENFEFREHYLNNMSNSILYWEGI